MDGVGDGHPRETAAEMAVQAVYGALQPAWALIDRLNLAALPIIDGVERLVVLVDRDMSGDGQKAAATCARRWRDAGRDAWRLTPDEIGDFNDIVLERKNAS